MTFISALSDGRFAAHNSYHGPFSPSGNTKYVPLLSSSLRTLGMAKATLRDPGDADWSQAGADASLSGSSDVVCLYAFHDAGNARIGVATAQSNGDFRYHQFNTSTESWDISDEVIRSPAASPDEYQAAASLPTIAVSWRSDGDVTAVHNGIESDQSPAAGIYRAIRTTSWTALQKSNNSGSTPSGIVTAHNGPTVSGNTDRTNFAVQRGTIDIRRWHYSSGTAIDNQNTGVSHGSAKIVLGPGAMDNAETVYFPYVNSNSDVYVVSWDADDDASSITITDTGPISDQGDVAYKSTSSAPFPPMGLVWDGTDVHLVYAADSDGDIYHNDDATGTGGTEAKIVSGVTCHHLSAGISADNADILLIYGNGNSTPVFKRVTIGGSSSPENYPLSSFLIGLRALPYNPDTPPPPAVPSLPPVEGSTLWEQRWDACLLTPHSLAGGSTWDLDTRGAVGFDDPSDILCNSPGVLRQSNWPSGTYETVYDPEIVANALKILATRDQYETLDQRPDVRDHTEFEFHKSGWPRSGRGWPPLEAYKLSYLIKLGDDFSISNPQWAIIWQAFGLGDSNDGSRNPWLPMSIDNGDWNVTLRGDSRKVLEGNKDYEYPVLAKAPAPPSLGPVLINTWELFEIRFLYDYRKTGGNGEGNAWCTVHRNGVLKLDISGIQLGYNDADGSVMTCGLYHHFKGSSTADRLSVMYGGVRFEKIS